MYFFFQYLIGHHVWGDHVLAHVYAWGPHHHLLLTRCHVARGSHVRIHYDG